MRPQLHGNAVSSTVGPKWAFILAPHLEGEEMLRAEAAWAYCSTVLRRQTLRFLERSLWGLPCRLVDKITRRALRAQFSIDGAATLFHVEELGHTDGALLADFVCRLADIRNIWVCGDSERARRVYASLGTAEDVNATGFVLIDSLEGEAGLLLGTPEMREDFLDCMSVLIASQRSKSEPELAGSVPDWLPTPPATLRAASRSLRSDHLSGRTARWLSWVGEDLAAQKDALPLETYDLPLPKHGERHPRHNLELDGL